MNGNANNFHIIKLALVNRQRVAGTDSPFCSTLNPINCVKVGGCCNIRWAARVSNYYHYILKPQIKFQLSCIREAYMKNVYVVIYKSKLKSWREFVKPLNISKSSLLQPREPEKKTLPEQKRSFLNRKHEAKGTFAWSPRTIIEFLGLLRRKISTICKERWYLSMTARLSWFAPHSVS